MGFFGFLANYITQYTFYNTSKWEKVESELVLFPVCIYSVHSWTNVYVECTRSPSVVDKLHSMSPTPQVAVHVSVYV